MGRVHERILLSFKCIISSPEIHNMNTVYDLCTSLTWSHILFAIPCIWMINLAWCQFANKTMKENKNWSPATFEAAIQSIIVSDQWRRGFTNITFKKYFAGLNKSSPIIHGLLRVCFPERTCIRITLVSKWHVYWIDKWLGT